MKTVAPKRFELELAVAILAGDRVLAASADLAIELTPGVDGDKAEWRGSFRIELPKDGDEVQSISAIRTSGGDSPVILLQAERVGFCVSTCVYRVTFCGSGAPPKECDEYLRLNVGAYYWATRKDDGKRVVVRFDSDYHELVFYECGWDVSKGPSEYTNFAGPLVDPIAS